MIRKNSEGLENFEDLKELEDFEDFEASKESKDFENLKKPLKSCTYRCLDLNFEFPYAVIIVQWLIYNEYALDRITQNERVVFITPLRFGWRYG